MILLAQLLDEVVGIVHGVVVSKLFQLFGRLAGVLANIDSGRSVSLLCFVALGVPRRDALVVLCFLRTILKSRSRGVYDVDTVLKMSHHLLLAL